MARKSLEELQKHTLNLYPGDYARIQDLFPDVGAGPIIRKVIREFINRVEASDELPETEIEF